MPSSSSARPIASPLQLLHLINPTSVFYLFINSLLMDIIIPSSSNNMTLAQGLDRRRTIAPHTRAKFYLLFSKSFIAFRIISVLTQSYLSSHHILLSAFSKWLSCFYTSARLCTYSTTFQALYHQLVIYSIFSIHRLLNF
jgi:hypothetical protein